MSFLLEGVDDNLIAFVTNERKERKNELKYECITGTVLYSLSITASSWAQSVNIYPTSTVL